MPGPDKAIVIRRRENGRSAPSEVAHRPARQPAQRFRPLRLRLRRRRADPGTPPRLAQRPPAPTAGGRTRRPRRTPRSGGGRSARRRPAPAPPAPVPLPPVPAQAPPGPPPAAAAQTERTGRVTRQVDILAPEREARPRAPPRRPRRAPAPAPLRGRTAPRARGLRDQLGPRAPQRPGPARAQAAPDADREPHPQRARGPRAPLQRQGPGRLRLGQHLLLRLRQRGDHARAAPGRGRPPSP